jgi:hypothetical protein
MAMTRLKSWPVALYVAGLVLFYLGERLLPGSTVARIVLDGVGGVAMLTAVVVRFHERSGAGGDLRRTLTAVVVLMAGGLLALGLHWLASPSVVDALGLADDGAQRFEVVITVLWPIALACAVVPLVFVEVALLSAAASPVLEIGRVRRSLESGLALALVASLLFVVNYLAHEHNIREDLSYAKTTEPSPATLLLVESLAEPLRMVLFFSSADDVKEEVEPYFEQLAATAGNVTLEVFDHDAEPALAKELKARKNGTVVLVHGENSESYDIGTDADKAKNKLKKLDEEIHKRLIKVAKPELVAYLTTGHGERDWTSNEDSDKAGVGDLRTLLRMFNYKVQRLGLAEGLATEVPDDASVVIVVGPGKEFLPEEIASLQTYLARGGDLLVSLDPEEDVVLAELLGPLGIEFFPHTLTHDAEFIPKTKEITDRQLLFSTRFSSHPSVKPLQKNASRFPVVMARTGYLEAAKQPADGKPAVVLKSMPKTWADVDGDLEFSAADEKRKVYNIGMAVERSLSMGDGEEAVASRSLVLADADLISDLALRNEGNTNLVANGLKWLIGEEALAGELTSEEDQKIQHTRKKDMWWFYSTTFGIPALVMGVGVLVTLRRRVR